MQNRQNDLLMISHVSQEKNIDETIDFSFNVLVSVINLTELSII